MDVLEKKVSDAFRRLAAMCPLPETVTLHVRLSELDGVYGDTEQTGKSSFVIRLDQRVCWDVMIDTIIHEYAHVLAWRPMQALTSDHDEFWGVAYSKVYRAWHGTT